MTAIAGIAGKQKHELVEKMLEKMSHRGWDWHAIVEGEDTTIGICGKKYQERAQLDIKARGIVSDGNLPGRFAQAQSTPEGFILQRDPIGVAPLYYGNTIEGDLCFASEVKGLLEATSDIHEMPPGTIYDGKISETYFNLNTQNPVSDSPEQIATELRRRLAFAVEKCVGDGNVGSWLSGGVDSSLMAALARPRLEKMHTFVAGLPGAPDLIFARQMANYLKTEHHEVIVNMDEILSALPEVIYYLESFDALLIRSSILNYLAAKEASLYVAAVFSGEGGDELFAGYDYIKGLNPDDLAGELIDITARLHNTALQRVDRCASANGTIPYVCFLDPDVVNYALRIPTRYKLHDGVEKWILRQAVADILPPEILNRPKAKFWQGAGVENLLSEYAEANVTTKDFQKERGLPNGWKLNSKEELHYYRIFSEHFGKTDDLFWMGRTKGAPVDL